MSFFFKKVVKQLGLFGLQIYLIMNLVGGQKKVEVLEMIEIDIVLFIDEDIVKNF